MQTFFYCVASGGTKKKIFSIQLKIMLRQYSVGKKKVPQNIFAKFKNYIFKHTQSLSAALLKIINISIEKKALFWYNFSDFSIEDDETIKEWKKAEFWK